MAGTIVDDLFIHELSDVFGAEMQITRLRRSTWQSTPE